MKLSDTTLKFLTKVGERSKSNFKDLGKPTPDHIYDVFKVLSMLEVCISNVSPEVLAKVERIAEWKQ